MQKYDIVSVPWPDTKYGLKHRPAVYYGQDTDGNHVFMKVTGTKQVDKPYLNVTIQDWKQMGAPKESFIQPLRIQLKQSNAGFKILGRLSQRDSDALEAFIKNWRDRHPDRPLDQAAVMVAPADAKAAETERPATAPAIALPQDKDALTDALVKQCTEGIDKIRSSEEYKAALQTMAKFHSYSFNNQILIRLQAPHSTRVASYTTWQQLERQVRKGEKSIKIFAPNIRKERTETIVERDGQQVKETGEKSVLTGFRLASVFDVSQTEGKELARLDFKPTTAYNRESEYVMAAMKLLHGQNMTIIDEGRRPGIHGSYYPATDTITIVDGHSPNMTADTMLHETAHKLVFNDGAGRTFRSDAHEVIAESAAYVAGTRLGVDMQEHSFRYVAAYSVNMTTEQIREHMQHVNRYASQIIHKLEPVIDHIRSIDQKVRKELGAPEEMKVSNSLAYHEQKTGSAIGLPNNVTPFQNHAHAPEIQR